MMQNKIMFRSVYLIKFLDTLTKNILSVCNSCIILFYNWKMFQTIKIKEDTGQK